MCLQPHVSKLAGGDHQQRGQPQTPSLQRRPRAVQHDLQLGQFIATGMTRYDRIRATYHKVHRDRQFAIADHHDQQQTINSQQAPLLLPTPSPTHQTQLLTIFLEEPIIAHPGPFPPAVAGQALVLDLLSQAPAVPRRGTAGASSTSAGAQGPQETAGQGLVLAAYSAKLAVAAAARRRGEAAGRKSCPVVAAGPASATVPPLQWWQASPRRRGPVPWLAWHVVRELAPSGAARVPVGVDAAWRSALASARCTGLAGDILRSGSWEPPPYRCFIVFLLRRRA